jgi:hypothetical protein
VIVHVEAALTLTVKLQLATVLFDPSLAEQVTGVVPTVNTEPDGGLHVTVTLVQPLGVGVAKLTLACPEPAGFSTAKTSSGQRRTQTRLLTVTVKLHVRVRGGAELLVVSQLTVVEPTGKLDPDGGLQAASGAEQLSGKVGAA